MLRSDLPVSVINRPLWYFIACSLVPLPSSPFSSSPHQTLFLAVTIKITSKTSYESGGSYLQPRQKIAVDCFQLGPLPWKKNDRDLFPPRSRGGALGVAETNPRNPLRTETPIATSDSPGRETFLVCHFRMHFAPSPINTTSTE